jgi:hypothetical protein
VPNLWLYEHMEVVVRVNVDESGCEDESSRIDRFGSFVIDVWTHNYDPITLDSNVANFAGSTRPVDYGRIFYHEVEQFYDPHSVRLPAVRLYQDDANTMTTVTAPGGYTRDCWSTQFDSILQR